MLSGGSEGQIIVIGADGIWETENPNSEKFEKFRLQQIIRQHSQFSAQEILNAITDFGLTNFIRFSFSSINRIVRNPITSSYFILV